MFIILIDSISRVVCRTPPNAAYLVKRPKVGHWYREDTSYIDIVLVSIRINKPNISCWFSEVDVSPSIWFCDLYNSPSLLSHPMKLRLEYRRLSLPIEYHLLGDTAFTV